MNKSIVLLSGGLDSLVSLGFSKEEYNIELALTFDYGQKSLEKEVEASSEIAKYYGLKHEIIELEFLKNITHTSVVSEEEVPTDIYGTEESAKAVWVPNRNGLFLNIAASFADSFGYDYILFGANKDEGQTFPDNTEQFREQISKVFESSTLKKPKVVAPLINYSKNDIVRIAMENSIPLELVRSCYSSKPKHCGVCESCNHLKKALIANKGEKYIGILFEE